MACYMVTFVLLQYTLFDSHSAFADHNTAFTQIHDEFFTLNLVLNSFGLQAVCIHGGLSRQLTAGSMYTPWPVTAAVCRQYVYTVASHASCLGGLLITCDFRKVLK
jgi:hypothetical protein